MNILKYPVAIALIMLACQLADADPQSWSSVLRKSASDPNPFRPSQHVQNNYNNNNNNNYYNNNNNNQRRNSGKHGDCKNNYDFDYIQLTLQWAPGFCRTHPEGCSKSQNRHFTIHGMWPTQSGTEEPSFCCFNNRFDMNALQPIMRDLEEYWPSLTSNNNRGFWSHEWLKHGTCSKNAPNMMGELNYFSETLSQTKRLRVLDTLKASGINPSRSKVYRSVDIQNALRQVTRGARVQIDCDLEVHQRVPILTGINFCYDRSMNFVDCRPNKSRCSREVYFIDT